MLDDIDKQRLRSRAQDAIFAVVSETGWSLPELQTRIPLEIQHNHLWNLAVASKTPSEAMLIALEGVRVSYALPKRMFGRDYPIAMRLMREAALMKKPMAERSRDALDIARMIKDQELPTAQLPWAWFILAMVLYMATDADLTRLVCSPEEALVESEKAMVQGVDYGHLFSVLRVNRATCEFLEAWTLSAGKNPPALHHCDGWYRTFFDAAATTRFLPFYLDAIEIAIICGWEDKILACVEGIAQGLEGRPIAWIGYWVNARLTILGAPQYVLLNWVQSRARKVLISLDNIQGESSNAKKRKPPRITPSVSAALLHY